MMELSAAKNNSRKADQSQSYRVHIPVELCSEDSITKEWIEQYAGLKHLKSRSLKRQIEKVPLLLRRDEQNRHEFDPRVISLGPYHHHKHELPLMEGLKLVILQKFVSGCGRQQDDLYTKILEVIDNARSCYVEDSTKEYNDQVFAQMMLLDGCFLVYFIECMAHKRMGLWPLVDHLGMLASKYLVGDMFLLENQLPFQVLDILMSFKFSNDEKNRVINAFFESLFVGYPQLQNDFLVEGNQPLHLLEAFRTSLLSGDEKDKQSIPPNESQLMDNTQSKEVPISYVKEYKQSFIQPISELSAKGIQFKRSKTISLRDIKFKSNYLYGELHLPPRIINLLTKTIYSNLIAYEMCPNTPNDFGITSYMSFMKSLIAQPDDVKELRSKHILINCLGSDEDVVRMYREIPAYDLQKYDIYDEVRESIQNHYYSKMKTWIAEFIHTNFRSPWTIVAFLAATSLLILSFVQTFFTIYPASGNNTGSNCTSLEKHM